MSAAAAMCPVVGSVVMPNKIKLRHASTTTAPTNRRQLHLTRRSSSSVVTRATAAIEPDGVLDAAPRGMPKDAPPPPTPVQAGVTAPLSCPVSLRPLDDRGFCARSGLQYAKSDGIWDLTIGAAINARTSNPTSLTDLARSFLPKELRGLLPQSSYMGTATFETPQVAFAYERGWRESFGRAGFPGPDEEFKLAEAKLLPFASGKVLMDASCGSGLFTRRFVKSGNYGCVIALDFSEAMLTQARQFAKDEGLLKGVSMGAAGASYDGERDDLVFVRADIGRVPLPEGSVGGVHAGAAIHCWPEPRSAVAEIARVLEPGATFCGTTFLTPRIPFADDAAQQAIDAALREFQSFQAGRAGGPRGFRQWNKLDLAELCAECGLVDFQCDVRDPAFIFYSAKKPAAYNPN